MSFNHYSSNYTQSANVVPTPAFPAMTLANKPVTKKPLIAKLADLDDAEERFAVRGERWCDPVRTTNRKKKRVATTTGALTNSKPRKPRRNIRPRPSPICPPQPPNTPFEPVGRVYELERGPDYSFSTEGIPTSSSGTRPIDENGLDSLRMTSLVSSAPWEHIRMYYPPPSPPFDMLSGMELNCNAEFGPLLAPPDVPTWAQPRGVIQIPTPVITPNANVFIQDPDSVSQMMRYSSHEYGHEMLPSTQSHGFPAHYAFANDWLSATPGQPHDQQPELMQYGQNNFNA
ncbi:hypothetical protein BJ165DRAFT_1612890 [Panaeolus papilionaceus]|nr:hypothetical protein BJ165DRAFT_1612890 [Panaeolus papilionaceus]